MAEYSAASEIHNALSEFQTEVLSYFERADREIPFPDNSLPAWHPDLNKYWNRLSPSLRAEADELIKKLLALLAGIAQLSKASALTSDADLRQLQFAAKACRSALLLRRFSQSDLEVIHDEGVVLGVKQASQEDIEPLVPSAARNMFSNEIEKVFDVSQLLLADPRGSTQRTAETPTQDAARYQPNTAFIMMWMDPKKPELNDVADTVRDTFKKFGIQAVRADDIEHEGQITQRILDEIRSSEFLFADLSGERPNVYYEVGYAHALKKRVILFRKSWEGIHFDLAGYNCPEYATLRDLREKLGRRLEQLTNRTASTTEMLK